MKSTNGIAIDPELGYAHLDPLPTSEELDRFYQEEYYDLIQAGGLVPELRRLMNAGADTQREIE